MPIYSEQELATKLSMVEGFLRPHEAFLLHKLSANLPAKAVAAEIGSWMGRSSIAIALSLLEKGGTMHTIDDHSGITTAKGYTPREYLLGEFEKNIESSGVRAVIQHHPKSSDALATEWNIRVDMLFIDGDHTYEAVVNDIKHYAHFVKPGGWLAFHDSSNRDVARAIKEWANRELVVPAAVAFAGTILAIQFPRVGERKFSTNEAMLLWKCFDQASCAIPKNINFLRKWRMKLSQSMARRLMRRWTREAFAQSIKP